MEESIDPVLALIISAFLFLTWARMVVRDILREKRRAEYLRKMDSGELTVEIGYDGEEPRPMTPEQRFNFADEIARKK